MQVKARHAALHDNVTMGSRFLLVPFIGALLSACSSLLPTGSNSVGVGFSSFEEARLAAERIVPLETRTQSLNLLGFDVRNGLNVTLVPYPEIVVRLTPHPSVPISALDSGIRQCIDIQTACRGYLFRFEREDRKREGSFWLDFFNLSRTTNVTGWRFETLIVVSDDLVLFRNYSGQARVDRVEKQTNPLGPFQPAGEGTGRSLVR